MSSVTAEGLSLVVPHDGGLRLNVIGDHQCIKLTGKQTSGQLMLSEGCNMPGVGIPLHYHKREDETFYVLEGKIEFTLGEKRMTLGAGDVVFAARNELHAWQVVGDVPGRMLVFCTPGGMEHMFGELAAAHALKTLKPEEIGAICDRYGICFPSPA